MGQYFRAGVGAVIRRPDGHVLAFERSDLPGAWQFPQGGLENDEEPFEAALREIGEETGIQPQSLTMSGRFPGPIVYELPAEARSIKTGRGQVQYWFRFDCSGSQKIDLPSGGEFRDCRWVSFDALLSLVVEFRRGIYEKLASSEQWETTSDR